MSIETLDLEIVNSLSEMEQGKFNAILDKFEEKTREIVLEEYEELKNEQDQQILANRGIRQLTTAEKDFYNKLAEAGRKGTPNLINNALSELDVVYPETVIDAIFDDITGNHPLLSKIRTMNINVLTTVYVSDTQKQLATWDELNTAITEELKGSFKKFDFIQNKLSCYIPVHNDMLILGPQWLDRYVRILLSEAIAYGLEDAIINGDGDKKPVGMIMDVATRQLTYTAKAPVKVTSLDPKTYGELLSTLTQTPNGHYRNVSQVLMVVNPIDYMKLVMPATTIQNANAGWVHDVLPFPTDIVQSEQMEQGKAVIGLADRYFLGFGNGQAKIESSDQYRWLEDETVYKTKMYAHGEPMDNNAFILCDISELTPTYFRVETVAK